MDFVEFAEKSPCSGRELSIDDCIDKLTQRSILTMIEQSYFRPWRRSASVGTDVSVYGDLDTDGWFSLTSHPQMSNSFSVCVLVEVKNLHRTCNGRIDPAWPATDAFLKKLTINDRTYWGEYVIKTMKTPLLQTWREKKRLQWEQDGSLWRMTDTIMDNYRDIEY